MSDINVRTNIQLQILFYRKKYNIRYSISIDCKFSLDLSNLIYAIISNMIQHML